MLGEDVSDDLTDAAVLPPGVGLDLCPEARGEPCSDRLDVPGLGWFCLRHARCENT